MPYNDSITLVSMAKDQPKHLDKVNAVIYYYVLGLFSYRQGGVLGPVVEYVLHWELEGC
jgi:hypothetical protein